MGRPLGSPVPAASWAVSGEVGGALLALREALPPRGSSVEADLARLALCVSRREREHVGEGRDESPAPGSRARRGVRPGPGRKGQQFEAAEVVDAFVAAAGVIGDDLAKMPGGIEARVLLGDARCLPLGDAIAGSAVFSPPYPNRYDYSAIYQLELAAGGFVGCRRTCGGSGSRCCARTWRHRRLDHSWCWMTRRSWRCCGRWLQRRKAARTSGAGRCGCWSVISMTCAVSSPSWPGCCGRVLRRPAWSRRRPFSAARSRLM